MSNLKNYYYLKYKYYKEKYTYLKRGGHTKCNHPYSFNVCKLRNEGSGCESIEYNIEENQKACICSPDTNQCIKTNTKMGKKYLEQYEKNIEKLLPNINT
jgi:hypothetical protein